MTSKTKKNKSDGDTSRPPVSLQQIKEGEVLTIEHRTYTDRMCDQFTNDTYDLKEVCDIIRNFSLSETAKKRADATKMSFGKYNMKSIKDILAFDKPYLVWLQKQTVMDNFPELKENIKNALL